MIFTAQDIINNYDARDLNRGRAYQTEGKVKDIQIENDGASITALVQGTLRTPYHVKVIATRRQGLLEIESDCTCPVGYMCKHAVAALYEAIALENRRHEKIGPHHALRKRAAILSLPVMRWVEQFEQEQEATPTSTEEQGRIVYNIELDPQMQAGVRIIPALQHVLRGGQWSRKRLLSAGQLYTLKQSKDILNDEDRALLGMIEPSNAYTSSLMWELPHDTPTVNYYLQRLIQTGRAFLDEECQYPLQLGAPLKGKMGWVLQDDGTQRATILPEKEGLHTLPMKAPWYFDPRTHEAGPLLCEEDSRLIASFLSAPQVTEDEAKILRKRLPRAKTKVPPPYEIKQATGRAVPPLPRITLSQNIKAGFENTETKISAYLCFDYQGTPVNPLDTRDVYTKTEDGHIIEHKRDGKTETALLKVLENHGLKVLQLPTPPKSYEMHVAPLAPAGQDVPWFWHDFLHRTAALLREDGFIVDEEGDLDCETMIIEPDSQDIDAAFTQKGDWWFSMDLGITVEGRRVPLLPILVSMLQKIRTPSDLEQLKNAEKCYAPLPDGRHVALPASRIYTIVKTLVELFEDKSLDDKGQLRVSMDVTAAFLKLETITKQRWLGEGNLRLLVEKLMDFSGIKQHALPKNLDATLRSYQTDGYNWLHFLGEYGLSGILADDMGLGKTIQALSYIQALKEKKKLDKPCLIVMPTSLIANWKAEATRFTPKLKILILHGKDRAKDFKKVQDYDLVFTTYPLLARDKDDLCEIDWSLVIVDEAQAIKNPAAKVTQAACALKARQRLCLTGTPVENHLGEAWSIFTFLMPGLLGPHKSFNRQYRYPIERDDDRDRKDLLVRRLRPFVLRRLKNEVAKELPPKTEIIRRVTLADDQRDLYETVRHVMNDRVREEIAAKGFARSQIIILDALLKLRQTCCDPRLVKLEAASKVENSAKLDELKEMLPTLIEEGRKILLFSQFTSMLDLIKEAVDELGIPYVELRGSTKDRVTPVMKFQKGEVPLFLISLKAGGTGLNLTAADTVIHYDPWWNPSVENQATDRAHRIGQDKPVFVYKLIVEGTVEEKILELQTRKAELAGALFGDDPAAAASLTQDDLRWLMGEA